MSHTEMAEEEAAMRASTLANQALCPVYLGPLTSPAAAEVVANKKGRGAVVYADTSAAAVILDGEEYWNKCWRHAASFLCSPPLREDDNGVKFTYIQITSIVLPYSQSTNYLLGAYLSLRKSTLYPDHIYNATFYLITLLTICGVCL